MGTKHRYPFLLALLCGLLWVSPALAETEPLRLLIPFFFGPTPLSQHVRTTINFEIIKAFRAVGPGSSMVRKPCRSRHMTRYSVLLPGPRCAQIW